ncbi:MAG TPA: outer membrane protein transport protein [Bryobacteraceae bacterium]
MTLTFNRHFTLVLTIASLLEIAVPGSLLAQGGALAVYEVGTPNIGEAYAGQSAVASDASTAFLNPAGMTRLAGFQLLAGSQVDLLSTHFRAESSSTAGGNGGNAGGAFLVPSVYATKSIGDRVSVGFSLNSPFGLGLAYADDWVGRYAVQRIRLSVVEASPAAAYRVNRWLSVGAGLIVERAAVTQRTAIPNLFEPALGDGQIDLRAHGWGTGFRVGALWNAGFRTRIGITYRSAVGFSLNGSMTPANIGPVMAAVLPPLSAARIPLSLPQGANVSVVHDLNRSVAVLADAGWTNWRQFGRQESQAPDGSTTVVDRNWRDTGRAGLGLRWRANPRTMLHTGVSYDSAPVSDWDRTPDLPIDRQWRFAAGVTRDLKPSLSVAFTCSYVYLGAARIEKSLGPLAGRLSGQYASARLPFFSVSFLFHRSANEE